MQGKTALNNCSSCHSLLSINFHKSHQDILCAIVLTWYSFRFHGSPWPSISNLVSDGSCVMLTRIDEPVVYLFGGDVPSIHQLGVARFIQGWHCPSSALETTVESRGVSWTVPRQASRTSPGSRRKRWWMLVDGYPLVLSNLQLAIQKGWLFLLNN